METQARYKLIGLFTLVTLLAGFAFVYWLYNTGGLRNRASYRVEFESSVSGLLVGSAVLFNGVRVGEVSRLELNPTRPKQVVATIAVDQSAPVAADTVVELEFQGLTGAPVINLVGGAQQQDRSGVSPSERLVLRVEPAASENLTRAAKKALKRFDDILATNEKPLQEVVTNINIFTAALAKNSGRIDGILDGVERMTSGGKAATDMRTFDLLAPTNKATDPKAPNGLLVVDEPTVLLAYNTDKVLLQLSTGERSSVANAKWTDNLPNLLQAKVLQSFENAGYVQFVSRPSGEMPPSYHLLIDIRQFQISDVEKLSAQVHLLVKVVDQSGRILKGRSIMVESAATSREPVAAVSALNEAFAQAMRELIPWVVKAIGAGTAQN